MKKKIIFDKEEYGAVSLEDYIRKEVLPYVPYRTYGDLMAECDIELKEFGYVHDTGFAIVITEHGEDRSGTGWDDLDTRYSDAVAYAKERWDYALEYGYH